jgi:hypothetical protein
MQLTRYCRVPGDNSPRNWQSFPVGWGGASFRIWDCCISVRCATIFESPHLLTVLIWWQSLKTTCPLSSEIYSLIRPCPHMYRTWPYTTSSSSPVSLPSRGRGLRLAGGQPDSSAASKRPGESAGRLWTYSGSLTEPTAKTACRVRCLVRVLHCKCNLS